MNVDSRLPQKLKGELLVVLPDASPETRDPDNGVYPAGRRHDSHTCRTGHWPGLLRYKALRRVRPSRPLSAEALHEPVTIESKRFPHRLNEACAALEHAGKDVLRETRAAQEGVVGDLQLVDERIDSSPGARCGDPAQLEIGACKHLRDSVESEDRHVPPTTGRTRDRGRSSRPETLIEKLCEHLV